jgi:hypothetical protein
MAIEEIGNYVALSGELATGGQPSEEHIQELAQAGVECIINLGLLDPRYCLADEAGLVRSLGVVYHHIPVDFQSPTLEDLSQFFTSWRRRRARASSCTALPTTACPASCPCTARRRSAGRRRRPRRTSDGSGSPTRCGPPSSSGLGRCWGLAPHQRREAHGDGSPGQGGGEIRGHLQAQDASPRHEVRAAGDHDVKAGSAAWEAHERYYEERPHETRLPPARHHWARPPES